MVEVREQVAQALGWSVPQPGRILAKWVEAYCEATGDPDVHLAGWLSQGAPLGVLNPVVPSGVFPPVVERPSSPAEVAAVASDPAGWTNYRSATDDPKIARKLLKKMTDNKWADAVGSWESVEQLVGGRATLNKLGLVSKLRPDGTWKHRLIWDLRESGINGVIRQGERVVLPRLSDVVNSARRLHGSRQGNHPVTMLVLDISDAFHQVPLNRGEQRFTVAEFEGTFYVFRVLVFGSASAPTVWGRVAAWLGRSTAAVLHELAAELHIYVDDPIFLACGTTEQVARDLTCGALWAAVMGFPLAWPKAIAGHEVVWIGASIRCTAGAIVIAIPDKMVKELLTQADTMLSLNASSVKAVRQFAGRMSFAAGLVPTIRPFLQFLWAAVAGAKGCAASDARSGPDPLGSGARRQAGSPLVFTRQIHVGLRWLRTFLARLRGSLQRELPWSETSERSRTRVCTDASPWGIGAVLIVDGRPVAWLADSLHHADLVRFRARVGDSAFNTIWEALAILVALRTWCAYLVRGAHAELRADSLAALGAVSKLASSAPGLGLIMREIALDEAENMIGFKWLEHVPGVANVWPDALSRMFAPEPGTKVVPEQLLSVPRTAVEPRSRAFWHTLDEV